MGGAEGGADSGAGIRDRERRRRRVRPELWPRRGSRVSTGAVKCFPERGCGKVWEQ